MLAVEHAAALRLWVAEALLSTRRRLREDLQGADGRHRLGQIRCRQLREMRQLHGALRLRGHGGGGFHQAPVEDDPGGAARRENFWADGAGYFAGESAAGRIRVLTPCGAQARRDTDS